MKSFEHGFLTRIPVSQELLGAVGALREFKGRQDLHKRQMPQALETLRQAAIIQSTESSNRIEGVTAPLIDQVHRLMHLWKTGEVVKVNEYLDARALRQNKIFHQLLQALIELAAQGSEERSLLEKISNHVVARGVAPQEELKL